MMWSDKAACRGADPVNFDPVDLHTTDEWATFEAAARRWCESCPVLAECGRTADANRHVGLWAGVYRRIKQGRYVWDVLAVGAAEPELTDRPNGVRTGGWVA